MNIADKFNKKQLNCLNCVNCEGNDFCFVKQESIYDLNLQHCDCFMRCKKDDRYNYGYSIIEPNCVEFYNNYLIIDKIKVREEIIIFKEPIYIEYDYFDNYYVAYEEILNIYSAQVTLKDLENDFINQICENLSSENAEFLKSFNKLVKSVGRNEKN